MTDEANPISADDAPQAPMSPRDRLRREVSALRKLARNVPKSKYQTPEQTAALHAAIDRYALVWRDVRLAAGLPIDAVFPPTNDPAERDLPVSRRTPRKVGT